MRFYPPLLPGQRSVVNIGHVDGREPVQVFSTDRRIEAPNWSRDGTHLVVNGDGRLWALPLEGKTPRMHPISPLALPGVNNDHVLSHSGDRVFVTCNDWHIYELRLNDGRFKKLTPDDRPGQPISLRFLHGLAPAEDVLAFTGIELHGVALRPGGYDDAIDLGLTTTTFTPSRIQTMPVRGGAVLTLSPQSTPADGAEYTPDGKWLYYNTEEFSPGKADIARMRPDGLERTRLTHDQRVNWFPHWNRQGDYATYLSFPSGTQGHPRDLEVEVLVVKDDWTAPVVRYELFGGQGTLNVNSWSPVGDRFAFVSYPVDA